MHLEQERPSTRELFERSDDEGCREELAEMYLPLAHGLARRYARAGQSIDDLVQVASIGLVKAIDRYDVTRGSNFEAFAVPTILGELKRYHRDRGWAVRMPRQLQERVLAVKAAVPELAQKLRRSPTVADLAAHIGIDEEQVLDALDARDAYSALSIDAPLGHEEGDPRTIADTLPEAEDAFARATEWADCVPVLRNLGERERRLIELRYFRDKTQFEIADELGISQMHVSRLLSQTLTSLREAVGAA